MKKYKDFKSYMGDVYYDEIMNAIKPLIIRNKDDLGGNQFVKVTWAEPADISVDGVTFTDLGNGYLEIRTSVYVDIEIEGQTKYDHDSDTITKPYNVFFKAKLENGLNNVSVIRTTEYNKAKFDKHNTLSQALIPYLYEEDIESEAEDFLKRIYPKALFEPMSLPVDHIAKSMGMEVYYAPLEDSIFGKTYFGPERVTVFTDLLGRETTNIITKPGTMLINRNVFFMGNIGTANNTIIHECVHWDRHRKAFELQRLLDTGSNHISCEIIESYDGIPEDSPALKWMEWQANQLAPRILMPAEMTKKKLNEFMNLERREHPHERDAFRMESAISRLSLFFQVSFIAAKLRAIELGYEQAQGSQVYCEGKRLPSFSFAKGVLNRNQSFVIDENNLLFNLMFNEEIGSLFAENKVVYINCMLCLNNPKYVAINDDGVLSLTDYALDHVDECCFIFNRKYNASTSYSDTFYRRCFLCRDVDSSAFIESDYDKEHKSNQSKAEQAKEMLRISDDAKEIANQINDLGGFSNTLRFHMKRKDVNEEELSWRSGLSTPTISKYLNDNDCTKKIENVLAVGKALQLNPVYMQDLLVKSNVGIPNTHTRIMLNYLIWNHSDDTIEEWQEKLDQANVNLKLPRPN